jgi:diadenosine tetraphosphate (Ap4A) HIT family hydrolase
VHSLSALVFFYDFSHEMSMNVRQSKRVNFSLAAIAGAIVLYSVFSSVGSGQQPQSPEDLVVPGKTQVTIPEFGAIEPETILGGDALFVVVRDKFPVSPGHTLILARRPAAGFQDLTGQEKSRLIKWIDWTEKTLLATLLPKPDGFNLGVNDGFAAGQTKRQFHFHIIPRYLGDVKDPRGGIRKIIPEKADYWDATHGKQK